MPKSLVIDDESALTSIIARFLEGAGFEVETATSGSEGLRKAILTQPDVAIVDVMMPEMDGYEVCRRLRRDPRTARTAILVLTARGQSIDREIALRAGADAHVVKPYKGKVLIEEIRQLLAARPNPTPPLGYQILVLRLQEGAGATTVATNLAVSLMGDQERMAVVADLVFHDGQIENMLGLPPTKSWEEVLGGDSDLLAGHLVRHESGLFALPAPPPGASSPDPEEVVRILGMLREWHDYVVIDTPFNLGALAPVMLGSSPLVILLLTPDPSALQTASSSMAALKRLGNRTQQVLPVLSMVDANRESLTRQVEAELRMPVATVLPWSPQECAGAVSSGKPVVLSYPDSPIAQAFQTLTRQVIRVVGTQPLRRIPR
jgi:CheY-like chemotaxis protein/MinD-like ATPase involved in chromosome partitioning or flagellar assembly